MTGEESSQNNTVAIDGEYIAKVGSYDDLIKWADKSTELIDLKGQTVLPGFIDAHGHFIMNALFKRNFIDCSCAPIGPVSNMEDLLNTIRKAHENSKSAKPIICYGFDDTLIPEYKMPTAKELNSVSTDRPIIVLHTSIHMLSANTCAMKKAKVYDNYTAPEGGTVYCDENGHPNGVFEEAAIRPIMKKLFYKSMLKGMMKAIKSGSQEYISQGITTSNEGASFGALNPIYKRAIKKDRLQTRMIVCPAVGSNEQNRLKDKQWKFIDKNGKLWIGPAKIVSDGSIQAHTAYLSEPYHTVHPTRPKSKDYRGFLAIDEDVLERQIQTLHASGRQCAIHCNGDASLDEVLKALQKVERNSLHDLRHIIIHCQTVRNDQLELMKKLGVYASFFPAHIYVWGDRHSSHFLGPERASRISPSKSSNALEMPFSLHNDAPVTPISPLGLVASAVNRKTYCGKVLGKEQKIDVYDALLGVTRHAAWQYHLDDYLGTIEQGKLADLVILKENPLKVQTEKISSIKVDAVIVGGSVKLNANQLL